VKRPKAAAHPPPKRAVPAGAGPSAQSISYNNNNILPIISSDATANDVAVMISVDDPYDPSMPNAYEEYLDDKKLREVDLAGRERSIQEMREIERELAMDREREEERDRDRDRRQGRKPGASIPPPMIYHKEDLMDDSPRTPIAPKMVTSGGGGGGSIAEKMMKNMGWKGEGHGLGRNQQGIAAPITMKQTGRGTGKIVAERTKKASSPCHSTIDSF
jgi:hypothetical protein